MMASSNSPSPKVTNHGKSCIICWKNVSRKVRETSLNSSSPEEAESQALLRLVSNSIFHSKESLEKTGIEIPWNFLDTLNLVWPVLEKEAEETRRGRHETLAGFVNGRFAEIPPICQLCADRIQAIRYFKRLSDRYLGEVRKSMEEAKAKKAPAIPQATLKLPWKPSFLRKTPPSSSSMETLQIERTTRGILNKLTGNGTNFDILTSQLVATLPFWKNSQDNNPDNQLIMNNVASLIFNKAVLEPVYCPAYARLVYVICKLSSKFRKTILDVCQSQFLQVCVEQSEDGIEEDEDKRQRCFGILNFIQELYSSKFKIIIPKIIVGCVEALVQPPVNQLKLECVYHFLAAEKQGENIRFSQLIELQLNALTSAVKQGEKVKYIPEDGWMDKIFEKLAESSKNTKFSGRIRCLLENLVELRGNGWRKERRCTIIRKITEMPWGRTVLKPIPPDEEPALTLWLFERKARGILNKVNLNNGQLFDRQFSRFLKLPFWFCGEYGRNELQIRKAAEMLFEKGVKEPMYCNAYAKMVKEISKFRRKYPYSRNFEKIGEIVVNRCIDEISKITGDAHGDFGEEEKFLGRERVLAVIKFIGELYNLEVFSARNMGTCMQLLINGTVSEVKVECVYKLLMCKFFEVEIREMVYYGEFLDAQLTVFRAVDEEDDQDVRWIDGMFRNMKSFAEDLRFGGRIRCLLMNLVELRGNGWKDKSKGIGSIAVLDEHSGKKCGKGRGRGVRKVPDGNWRN